MTKPYGPPNLPNFQRLITNHNSEGKAVFDGFGGDAPWLAPMNEGRAAFSTAYITNSFPVNLTDDKDLAVYSKFLESPPGLVVGSGTVLRIVDIAPDFESPMHRTVSLDYGVVLMGEIELELDSGETRMMKVGDIAVQRGTNHLWRNKSKTDWCRMMYVLQPSLPLEFKGKKLGEELGDMEGVPKSH
ncbi:hypothetical protein ANO11243_056770 [Dothideomycetidae sp. 11243]|nr:hypothetical protein ANO11243_056770 [fungal sp. No.11243]